MDEYVGIDVSVKEAWLCVVNEAGKIVHEGKTVSDPEAIRDPGRNASYPAPPGQIPARGTTARGSYFEYLAANRS